MERGSGMLLNISSLPSDFMIGQLDKNAFDFVDFLHDSKMTYWQMLPLAPTSFGDSPYQSPSAYAINEYYISLEKLYQEGLLTKEELDCERVKSDRVDYEYLFNTRFKVLKKAFDRFDSQTPQFKEFCQNENMKNYALFKAIKTHQQNKPFLEWEDKFKFKQPLAIKEFKEQNENEILFYLFCQFVVEKQYLALKEYANSRGVFIIGDMPIYVATDSVEVYEQNENFLLDENTLNPTLLAGVPPDCFTDEGQLWGNPIYNYEHMKKDNYKFFVDRISNCLKYCDILRIDHFRGFSSYYTIESGYTDAKIGKWFDAPGYEIFKIIKEKFSDDKIIGEDLGDIDDKAREFFKFAGYKGMKILQFAFDGNDNNEHLPQNSSENFIMYTGTHDNDALLSQIESLLSSNKERFINSLRKTIKHLNINKRITEKTSATRIADIIIEIAFASVCSVAIVTHQDFLHLDNSSRMNLPSTVSTNNWSYRAKSFDKNLAKKIKKLNEQYRR